MERIRRSLALCSAFLLAGTIAHSAPPRLERHGTAVQLLVQGRPVLIVGGELGNSSASSAAYMARYWPRLRQMHLNTVLAPVSWELIEPREGQFNWSSVDTLLTQARAQRLHLILLWFGSWKNSMSTYVPAWVKRDQSRFPRAQLPDGRSLDILSALNPAIRDADVRAFTALMAHIRATDQTQNTVLMVQVENEMGMLPVPRDHAPEAERRFHDRVPDELVRMLALDTGGDSYVRRVWQRNGAKRSGNWTQLFGEGDAAAEIFTAWHYARFTEAVAAAGKSAYALPMYVNAALNRPNARPGEYPSGGPVPHLIDVWKAGAPSIDIIAPDIYFRDFIEPASRYHHGNDPLFVPEAGRAGQQDVPANAFYAFGKLDALGFSPFSIESVDDQLRGQLAAAYDTLEQLTPFILASQGLGRMSGFRPRVLEDGTVQDAPVTETIGAFKFTVSFIDTQSPRAQQNTASHGGMIIEAGPEDYIVAGQGMIVTFEPADDALAQAGIDNVWEGSFDAGGKWVPGRLLNGDQTHQGRHLRLAPGRFQIQRVRLYRYR